MRKQITLAFTLLLVCSSLFAQKKNITLDEIWKQYKFMPRSINELRSTTDGKHYTILSSDGGTQAIVAYDYKTGKATDTLLTARDITKAGKNFSIESYAMSPGEKKILVSTGAEHIFRHSTVARYFVWDREKKTLTQLTDGNDKVMYATLSPDGNRAAYVFKGDLYTKNLIDGKTTRITNDGSTDVFNGVSDWVYEEEFVVTQGYFWSPDSKAIAFYRFDDSKVPTFSMNEYKDSLYPTVYSFKYPKCGEDNPMVTIHVYNIDKGSSVTVVAPKYYEYVPRIKWTQNSNTLSVQYMDRHQDTLVLALADANTGKTTPILTEGDKGYIDINDVLTFINNNTEFLWMSDADGYNHLYRYSISGKLINQITSGKWDVIDVKGINEKAKTIYFISSETSAIDKDLYSVNWESKEKKKLSTMTGSNNANFSSDYSCYISNFTSNEEPGLITLNGMDGKQMRVLEDNHDLKEMLKTYNLGKKSFFMFTTTQGNNLNGWVITPPDFDSTKKYPVLLYVYGGPGANTVNNTWDGLNNMWFQMMAEKGYIIASVDNRGTGGRGSAFKKCTYMHLGDLETQDQMEAAKYFGSKSFVDKNRIGIWGWSYGGYMAALCITKGAEVFKAAISVAPVTNWKYYDDIYTERYMRTPKENPDGYENGSPMHYAKDLKGNYLLIHGTGDDNVHFQNSIEFISALQKAEKPFSLMIYPDKNHGIYGGNTRYYLFNEMTNFWLQNL
jgi:dipeptidyl-peptidase-4